MEQSIKIMKKHLLDILWNNKPSIYIFGSITLDDFKLGWSDIDILCLTKTKITDVEANQLLNLRQTLLEKYKDNLYFRLFEGGVLSLDEFINNDPDRAVYWGTSGQRITNKYRFDPFSMMELIENGYLIYGDEVRNKFKYPSEYEITQAIINHYEAIRKYAVKTERSLYSLGWMLDIARCIYILRTGKIIAKTKAGEWALEKDLVPDVDIMEKVIKIRREPNKYKNDDHLMEWTKTLGPYIQRFCDVLEKEISYVEIL